MAAHTGQPFWATLFNMEPDITKKQTELCKIEFSDFDDENGSDEDRCADLNFKIFSYSIMAIMILLLIFILAVIFGPS